MVEIYKKIFLLFFILGVFVTHNAYAVSKLDFFTDLEEYAKKVQDKGDEGEKKIADSEREKQDKIIKADGQEGSLLFNDYIKKAKLKDFGTDVFKDVRSGNFDFSSSMQQLGSQLTDYQVDLNTAQLAYQDYKNQKARARYQKRQQIEKRLNELNTEMSLESTKNSPERKDEIIQEIAELEKQLVELDEETANADKKEKELEQKVKEASDKVAEIDNKLSQQYSNWVAQFKVDDLFGLNKLEASDEQNENLYRGEIESLFLAEDELETAQTTAPIRQARRQEYHKALQNLFNATVSGTDAGKNVEDSTKAYMDTITKADGLYGSLTMKIGIDISNARVAARFTELLLAEARFNAASELNQWGARNARLRDYNKDFTRFNMDEYVLKEKSVMDNIKEWTGF